MNRQQIIDTVEKEKLVAILRGIPQDKLIPLCEALFLGGVRLLEITYDASGKLPDSKVAESIGTLVKHFDGRMLIGAGTVLTEEQVVRTAQVGGGFIISPDVNEGVIRKTRDLGLVSMPGALTPTEMQAAHRAGADFVKLFPITDLGPSYVKAVRAPLSHLKVLAVGGIDEKNIPVYLAAGVCGFGVGSNITNKKMIDSGDFAGITALAERYVAAIRGGQA